MKRATGITSAVVISIILANGAASGANAQRQAEPPGAENSPGAAPLGSAGFVPAWLVAGPFDLTPELRSSAAMLPAPAWDKADDNALASATPTAGDPAGATTWRRVERAASEPAADLRGAIPEARHDRYAYAMLYVHCPQRRECRVWVTSAAPCAGWMNDKIMFHCGNGGGEDGISRRVSLLEGWNRLVLKVLDQEDAPWRLGARLTYPNGRVMEDLEFSTSRPGEHVVPAGNGVTPLRAEPRKYRWADVAADWRAKLPVLSEPDFDGLLGQHGTRFLTAPRVWNGSAVPDERRSWLLIDTTGLQFMTSRRVPPTCEAEALQSNFELDNVLNRTPRERGGLWPAPAAKATAPADSAGIAAEGFALMRMTRSTGSVGDLVFVRPDLVEAFIRDARYPAGWSGAKHEDCVLGRIARGGFEAVVFDTNLGSPLPATELDMLAAHDARIALCATVVPTRLIRGKEGRVHCVVAAQQPIGPGGVRGTLTLLPAAESRSGSSPPAAAGGDGGMRPARSGPVAFEIGAGGHCEVDVPADTRCAAALVRGATLVAEYTSGDQRDVLEKPVALPLFDALEIRGISRAVRAASTAPASGAVAADAGGGAASADGPHTADALLTPGANVLSVAVVNRTPGSVRGRIMLEPATGTCTVETAEQELALADTDIPHEVQFTVRVAEDAKSGEALFTIRSVPEGAAPSTMPARMWIVGR